MELYETMKQVLGLGLEPKDLTFLQISLRGIIVFIAALTMVRLGARRFMAKLSAFDAIVGFILASMLARAVNASSAFFPTLGGGFVIVGVHFLIAKLSFRFDAIGTLVKGRPLVVVEDGKPNRRNLSKSNFSEKDLMEEARLNGHIMNLDNIRRATVERNGQVSIIPTPKAEA